jgi:hypothetical protein
MKKKLFSFLPAVLPPFPAFFYLGKKLNLSFLSLYRKPNKSTLSVQLRPS